MEYLYYFAYGSNMCTERLKIRNINPSPDSFTAILPGYKLKFNKKSIDGSGKCNVIKTENEYDEVYGVVYEVLVEELNLLDDIENGYDRIIMPVNVGSEERKISLYVSANIDDKLVPYTWYKSIVIKGAKEHALPEHYITELEEVHAVPDPDGDRDRRNRI